jgi:hypothetical protein
MSVFMVIYCVAKILGRAGKRPSEPTICVAAGHDSLLFQPRRRIGGIAAPARTLNRYI